MDWNFRAPEVKSARTWTLVLTVPLGPTQNHLHEDGQGLQHPSVALGHLSQFEKPPQPKQRTVLDGSAHAQFLFQCWQRIDLIIDNAATCVPELQGGGIGGVYLIPKQVSWG
jgi:hypothetical protein